MQTTRSLYLLMLELILSQSSSIFEEALHSISFSSHLLPVVFYYKPPTREEALGAEETDTEPQDGQFVQAGDDIFREGQQAGKSIKL